MTAKCGILGLMLLASTPVPRASAIINGYVDVGHPAVGVVTDQAVTLMNSAVLIDPHWVLTSASFASACASGSFRVGADWAQPDAVYPFSEVFPHPSYDPADGSRNIALIKLSAPVTGVSPLPCLTVPSALAPGSSVELVGFGTTTTYDDGNTVRHGCVNPVGELYPLELGTTYVGSGPYFGDQGGPALLTVGGTQYVAGIIALCSEGGLGTTISTRVTSYSSWIQQVIDEHPSGVPAPDAPAAARLLGVAPNPFRPATVVSFVLAGPGPCRLAIFDPLGREVAVLADGWLPAGRHEVRWDGRSAAGTEMPPGAYFAALRAAGRTESRKVVLAR